MTNAAMYENYRDLKLAEQAIMRQSFKHKNKRIKQLEKEIQYLRKTLSSEPNINEEIGIADQVSSNQLLESVYQGEVL